MFKKNIVRIMRFRLKRLLYLYTKYNEKIEDIKNGYLHKKDSESYKISYKNRTDGYSLYFYCLDKIFIIIKKMNKLYLLNNSLLNQSIYKKFSDHISLKLEQMSGSKKSINNKPLLVLSDIWATYRLMYDETQYLKYNQSCIEHIYNNMNDIESIISKRETDISDLIEYINGVLIRIR